MIAMELNGSHVGLTARFTFHKKDKKRTEVVKTKLIEHVKHYRGGDVELGPTRTAYSIGKSGWWEGKDHSHRVPFNAEVEFLD